ncbi:hypothetical protein yrohd0001_27150 [Yersinia rohdei ATCC 43380]|nr:hypothetical protein yrohd0001_27150 [Yersinia rohdei ATCC 43380]
MLLLLVMNYGLTFFYLVNPISNDIHCVLSIKQQDILPMLIPRIFHGTPANPALFNLVHPAYPPGMLPFTVACCCR